SLDHAGDVVPDNAQTEAARRYEALGIVPPRLDPGEGCGRMTAGEWAKARNPGQQGLALVAVPPGIHGSSQLPLFLKGLTGTGPAVGKHLCAGQPGSDLTVL